MLDQKLSTGAVKHTKGNTKYEKNIIIICVMYGIFKYKTTHSNIAVSISLIKIFRYNSQGLYELWVAGL
jgi:hypothetical protein